MGFSEYKKRENDFDIILMLNLLDRCGDAEKMIDAQLKNLKEDGTMIISMPFPINARHGHGIQNARQKALSQKQNMSFEKSVSLFYQTYLKSKIELISFSRMPYLISNPEMGKISIFDNAVFVCQKK